MGSTHLRVGFIGAGANTVARHLPGFAALPDVEFAAVANRSLESGLKVAKGWRVRRAEQDWRAIVEAPDIDAVCIGTWPATHAEMAVAALRAGKHVLCEARMASSLAEAMTMLDTADANPHLVAQIVPAPFTLAFDDAAKSAISSGELGELRKISVTQTNGAFLDRGIPLPWRLERRHSGVNMLTLGIYYEILERWTGAAAVPTHAYAKLRPAPEGHPWKNADLPESIQVQGAFESLGGCVLEMNLSAIHEGEKTDRILVEGERASLLWDGVRQSLEVLAPDGSVLRSIPPLPGDRWRVEADFVDSIRLGKERHPVTLTSFAAGVSYMRFTQAAFDLVAGKF